MIINLAEKGWMPDALIRFGIRRLCEERLRDETLRMTRSQGQTYRDYLQSLRESPIATETDAANEQHYEVPSGFYQLVLGPHLKYSSCWWDEGVRTLGEAEQAMLQKYAERAQLRDGQHILELGCGWGSLTLWMAQRFPRSQIVAVSNSSSQREYIVGQAHRLKLANVNVITSDVNDLQLDQTFDRVVSVEMFEHVRNYQKLMQHISQWLGDDGLLFVHIFGHQELLYPFETEGDKNWMGKYFFTGGQMPSADTLPQFQDHLGLINQWSVPGYHYQKTARAWLDNLDRNRAAVYDLFCDSYGQGQADIWIQRWRMFFMSCEELFGYRYGKEWLVFHYLFAKLP